MDYPTFKKILSRDMIYIISLCNKSSCEDDSDYRTLKYQMQIINS